jgi:hypothetical protein
VIKKGGRFNTPTTPDVKATYELLRRVEAVEIKTDQILKELQEFRCSQDNKEANLLTTYTEMVSHQHTQMLEVIAATRKALKEYNYY